MKPAGAKGSNRTTGEEDFAASAGDPMKPAGPKGSNLASGAGFCYLCRRPDETRRGQRQQSRLGSKILLPPPKTRIKMGTEDELLAKEIFCYYCEQHHLDKERVGKPEGALTKQYDSSCNDL